MCEEQKKNPSFCMHLTKICSSDRYVSSNSQSFIYSIYQLLPDYICFVIPHVHTNLLENNNDDNNNINKTNLVNLHSILHFLHKT